MIIVIILQQINIDSVLTHLNNITHYYSYQKQVTTIAVHIIVVLMGVSDGSYTASIIFLGRYFVNVRSKSRLPAGFFSGSV